MTPIDVVLIYEGVALIFGACLIYYLQRQRIAELQGKLQKIERSDAQSVTEIQAPPFSGGYDHQLLKLEMKTLIYELEKRLSNQNLLTWILIVFFSVMVMIVLGKP